MQWSFTSILTAPTTRKFQCTGASPHEQNHGNFSGLDPTKLRSGKFRSGKTRMRQKYGIWFTCTPRQAPVPVTVQCCHRFGATLGRHHQESSVAAQGNSPQGWFRAPFTRWTGACSGFPLSQKPVSPMAPEKAHFPLLESANSHVHRRNGSPNFSEMLHKIDKNCNS